MAEESNGSNSEKENVSYVRKKNIISGVDNDFLLAVLGGSAIALGIANLPQVQEWVRNIFKNVPQLHNQQPTNGNQQQVVPNPPEVPQIPQQPQMPKTEQQIHQEQQRYARTVEEEGTQMGNQYNSFNALPERTLTENKKKQQPYTPGSSVSAGY